MDMTDLKRAPEATMPLAPENTDVIDPSHWRDVIGGMSAEIAVPLTAALERVHTLASTGRIDRASLRSLGEEIQRARQISMSGQQIARLASGHLRQNHERVVLTDTLKEVLLQRSREIEARSISVKPILRPADVVVDASLLFSLLNTLLTWAMEQAHSGIELRTDLKTWPVHARLSTKFAYRPLEWHVTDEEEAELKTRLDSVTWRLVEQTAWTMGLPIERKLEGHELQLTIEFPRTVSHQLEGMSAIELDQGFAPSLQGKPLLGSQVLVVASRRDVRVQIRDAIRHMGLIVDFVNSVDEAREFCRGGLPHALVIESVLRGARFNELRSDIDAEGAEVVFIEIIEEGNTFEISGFGGLSMARVGRDAILTSLPSALMFELSKTT